MLNEKTTYYSKIWESTSLDAYARDLCVNSIFCTYIVPVKFSLSMQSLHTVVMLIEKQIEYA